MKNSKATKTFYFTTLGCPKNDVASETAASSLMEHNYRPTTDPAQADILIVNGCAFIQPAIDEAKDVITTLSQHKLPGQKLYVFGCLAQRFADPSSIGLSAVDGFYPLWQDLYREIAAPVHTTARRLPIFSTYAYVEIAQGCSRSCTYCTIPHFKGPYISKPPQTILAEIKTLLENGIREIILVAQETTFYGCDTNDKNMTLAKLLQLIVQKFPNLPRIRIMYAHPSGITMELIETIAQYDQICKYLDIPLQHVDPIILKSMNRPFNVDHIERMLSLLRGKIPRLCLRSTFIVGFPGEGEREFTALLDFLKRWQFDKAGFFSYSAETETKAFSLPNPVSEQVKHKRLQKAFKTQQSIMTKKNNRLIGSVLPVLVESRKGNLSIGRSQYEAPEIDGEVLIKGKCEPGHIVPVTITRTTATELYGFVST